MRSKRLTARQKASRLFHLWHCLQDMKAEAAALRDDELTLLIGMMELSLAERTAGLGGMHDGALAAGDTARPN